MKLNLGCGLKKEEKYINIDDDPGIEPDFLMNLDDINIKFPYEDNSVEEIRAWHIFEHINHFIPLMQEMYRVLQPNGMIDIHVPHHLHDFFYNDPTHVRPITVEGMNMFSKKICEARGNRFAQRYNVDFEVIWYEYIRDNFYADMITNWEIRSQKGQTSREENFAMQRLLREGANVTQEVWIKMVAIK